jgi:hypothetical protein
MINGRARNLVESSRSAFGTYHETADDDSWNLVDLFSLNSWISYSAMSSTLAYDVIEEIVALGNERVKGTQPGAK